MRLRAGRSPCFPHRLATLTRILKSRLDTDLALAVKTGNADAVKKAVAIVRDDKAPAVKRASLLQALAEASKSDAVPVLLDILSKPAGLGLKKAALSGAAKFQNAQLAKAVLDGYEGQYAGELSLRDAAHRMLASRKEWARMFLDAVDKWHIKPADVAPDIVRQLALYKEPELVALIAKHWKNNGKTLSSADKQAEAQRIRTVLAAGRAIRKRVTCSSRSAAPFATHYSAKAERSVPNSRATNARTWTSGSLQCSLRALRSVRASVPTW